MNLSAYLDRQRVPFAGRVERHLLVQLQAAERSAQAERQPLNLALVIDRSGSMAGSKLEKAKEAALFCIRNLSDRDRVAVVVYDDQVRVVSSSQKLTSAGKSQLLRDVSAIQPGGSTNLGGGWLQGAQEVAPWLDEAATLSRVILLSDGLANVGITDNDELAHHASELRRRGISTTTMGIGADFNEELLERLALGGGGHFYFIEDARQIPDFLHRELGELLQTSARAIQVEVEAPALLEVELLNSFDLERQGRTARVRLDDMYGGESRSLVFRLYVPVAVSGLVGERLPFRVRVSFTDVESGDRRTAHAEEVALVNSTVSDCEAEQPNPQVIEAVALLKAAAAREEALRLDRERRYEESAATLASAAVFLRRLAPSSPQVLNEADALQSYSEEAEKGMTAMGRKRMHYEKAARHTSRKQ